MRGPSLVDPDMDLHPAVMGGVYRRRGRSVVDKCQPTGVAVREDVHASPWFSAADLLNQRKPEPADLAAGFSVFIGDRSGCGQSHVSLVVNRRRGRNSTDLSVNGMGEIDCRGACVE